MSPEWTSTTGLGKQQNGRQGTEEEREVDQSVHGEMISSKRQEVNECKWHKIVKSGSVCRGYPTAVAGQADRRRIPPVPKALWVLAPPLYTYHAAIYLMFCPRAVDFFLFVDI